MNRERDKGLTYYESTIVVNDAITSTLLYIGIKREILMVFHTLAHGKLYTRLHRPSGFDSLAARCSGNTTEGFN